MEIKILMVCLGNICRSPIAEGVMQSVMKKNNLTGKVDSAGILLYHSGQAPDKRAIRISGDNCVDISSQRARQIKPSDFKEYDFIFTMDRSVHMSILDLATDDKVRNKVHLFMEYAGYPEGTQVPDPYYSGMEAFQQVYELVNDACEKIISKWNDNR